jgi:uncharacterized membrane protein YphA (DoxX/SURF4 family)
MPMEKLARIGRWFFAICLCGLAGQEIYFGDFLPIFVPPFPNPMPGQAAAAYLLSILVVGAAVTLVMEVKARTVMLLLGCLFLLLFVFCHVPYEVWVDPQGSHVGAWGNALKELSMAGGAFVMAGSFPGGHAASPRELALTRPLEHLIPAGRIFFSIMLVVFGIEHFLYAEFVQSLVPAWIPGHLFWTYFAAVALIGSGLAIIFRIRTTQVAILLGIMIFLWFIVLHIPRGLAAPVANKGNELSSVFESLGDSGIAFVIAYVYAALPQLKLSR